MKIKFRKKLKRKLFMLLPLCILLLIFAWIAFHPAMPVCVEYAIRHLDEEDLEAQRRLYSEESSESVQLIRESDVNESENPEDYCKVSLNFTIRNCMPLAITNFSYMIVGEDSSSPIIGKYDYATDVDTIGGWRSMQLDGIGLFIYKEGKTDEEIMEYLKNVTIKITYASRISNGHEITIRLKDYLKERSEG